MAKILFPVIACALLMPMGVLTSVLHDGGLRETYWGNLGDIRHLVLNTSIPEGRPRITVYGLGVPPITRDRYDRLVEKWYPDSVFNCEAIGDSGSSFEYRSLGEYEESIVFGPSGDIEYMNMSAEKRWNPIEKEVLFALSTGDNGSIDSHGLLTRDEASRIAVWELQTHPGFPDGFYLETTHVSYIIGSNYSLISGYIFDFSRKLNGHRVIGDRTYIHITPIGGISYYHAIWRQVMGQRYKATVVSATEATLYLDTHLPVWFCGVQPGVRIDKVELGYHFGYWEDIWPEMRPVWIFNATVGEDSRDTFYVDALNLELWET